MKHVSEAEILSQPSENVASTQAGTYRLEDQIGYLLRRAHQRHLSLFNDRMGDGITPQQFAALTKLRELGKTSQNELGRQIAMDQSTINGVVKRLMARGLVERVKSPTDQRRLLVSLTDTGRDMVQGALPAAHEISDATLAPLSDRERKTLSRLLAKLG